MKDFKKGNRFGGGPSKGAFTRGGFGGAPRGGSGGSFRGGDRDLSRPLEMHQAKCANCGKMCEVPFLPNGKKPVFCKECFAEQRGESKGEYPRRDAPRHDAPRSFQRREESSAYAPARASTYASKPQATDRSVDELKTQLGAMNRKLDVLIETLETLARTMGKKATEKTVEKVIEKAPKEHKALGAVVKKVAKKTAPKKK